MHSPEFEHVLAFFDKNYAVQREQAKRFIEQLEIRKSFLDYKKTNDFYEEAIKRDYLGMPIISTGGYNDHFLSFISHVFNTQIVKCHDYLNFVILAIDYLNKWTNDCFFRLDGEQSGVLNHCGKLKADSKPKQHYFSLKQELYPYLLVNIRSGATFTMVTSKDTSERIFGTSIGASFFWGVLRLLNHFQGPTEAVEAAAIGDSSKIDMSVGDIYGSDYAGMGLPGSMIASSFGKLKDCT